MQSVIWISSDLPTDESILSLSDAGFRALLQFYSWISRGEQALPGSVISAASIAYALDPFSLCEFLEEELLIPGSGGGFVLGRPDLVEFEVAS